METFKKVNPSAERNREPIVNILRKVVDTDLLPGAQLKCLEIASGSGTHVGYFAPNFPHIIWQPSDLESENIPSLKAYQSEHQNILDPLIIDVSKPVELSDFVPDLILCINMIHISPWSCTLGLLANAGDICHHVMLSQDFEC